jgi:hypothetical protein
MSEKEIWEAIAGLKALITNPEIPLADGWTPSPDPWVYVSATQFGIAGKDRRSLLAIGTRVRYNDGATDYGTIISATMAGSDTLITLAPNNDYAIADTASHFLADCFYSYSNPPDYPDWFAWTPAVASAAGAITSYTVNFAKFKITRHEFRILSIVTISNNGTGSGSVTFTLPLTVSTLFVGHGREAWVAGKSLQMIAAGGSGTANIYNYDDSYPGSTGAIFDLTGTGNI